jgi:plasminogen activator inhibitor 1 RNA-binding protein
MALGNAVNNRFDLFIDEEEDPTELLQKQVQQKQQAEKSRADKDKPKPTNAKEVSKNAAGVSTKALKSSVVRQQQVTANSPTVYSTQKPPGKQNAGDHVKQIASGTDVTQRRPTPRQDYTFRERPELSDTRSSDLRAPSGPRRGRGQSRGGLGANADSGFDRFGKREFERRSGSDKTGLKPIEKRSGGGAHNWGTITDAIDAQLKIPSELGEQTEVPDQAIASANVEAMEDGTAEAVREDAVDEEEKQMTLEEWKAMQERQRIKSQFNIRKPGEGCSTDPKWKKMQVLKKKEADEEQTAAVDDEQFEDADTKPKNIVPIAINFSDRDRRGGGGGRRGRGAGTAGRGGAGGPQRGNRPPGLASGEQVPNVDSEQDFPSLG